MWNIKLRTAIARFSQPKTQPSLFHYIKETPEPKTAFSWKEFAGDLFSFRNPLLIPSVFSDPEGLLSDRARGRTRQLEAGIVSFIIHAAILSLAFLMIHKIDKVLPQNENIVFLNNPITLPFIEGDGQSGGGGGGGGKNTPGPWATGRMPDAARVQMLAPDPQNPTPINPAEDMFALLPSVQMPIDIPQDSALLIGDIIAPPNSLLSPGPGKGDGIGSGNGTGVGIGDGPGVGYGKNGGMGGGPDGGIGNVSGLGIHMVGVAGVKPPVILLQPRPAYTEEARKARAEGSVILQAIIRKNGTVDSFRILRSLGYGLDESAIKTIGSSWRFRPGTLDGAAVDVQANIIVEFHLY
jgi:periplasmic protein TonB